MFRFRPPPILERFRQTFLIIGVGLPPESRPGGEAVDEGWLLVRFGGDVQAVRNVMKELCDYFVSYFILLKDCKSLLLTEI